MRTPWSATTTARTRAAHPTIVGSDWPLGPTASLFVAIISIAFYVSHYRSPEKTCGVRGLLGGRATQRGVRRITTWQCATCVAHPRHGDRSRSDGAATTHSFTDAVEHFVAADQLN